MFLINETLNPEKIPQGKEEEFFQQHVAWFTRHFEQGNFLLVGPYTDQEMFPTPMGWQITKSMPLRREKSPGILLRTRVNKMALNDCLK